MSLQNGNKNIYLRSARLMFFLTLLSSKILSIPQLNIADPNPVYTIYGSDKYFTRIKGAELSLHITPYFQHTSTASKKDDDPTGAFYIPTSTTVGGVSVLTPRKNKVPIGNIYGSWNMFGLFFNDARPSSGTFTELDNARSVIASLANVTGGLSGDFTQEINFNPDCGGCEIVGYYKSVEVEYQKAGLRGKIGLDFGFGLGMDIKGGFGSYSQIPRFIIADQLTNILTVGGSLTPPYTGNEASGTTSSPTVSGTPPNLITAPCSLDQKNAQKVCMALMSDQARTRIARELDLNLSRVNVTGLEDTHVRLYWNVPFECCKNNETIVTIAPHFGIGAWLPTGLEADPNRAFSLSTGNEGYAALTIESAINFDFIDMLQFSIGGGGVFYGERTLRCQRVPTSIYQVGIIPWKTDIKRKPGSLWYLDLALKAEDFIPDFSFYLEWQYTEHQHDEICVINQSEGPCPLFLPGVLEERSKWKIQNVTASIKYNFSKNCAIGLGLEGVIHSERTYRSTTLFGSVIITF